MAKSPTNNKAIVKVYSAPLERLRSGLGWVIAYLPFDAAGVWGSRGRLKVKGEINGFAFRTSLFPTRDGRHFLLINKRMQKGAHAVEGTVARFRLEPDLEERTVTVPAELKRVLAEDRSLLRWFDKLNYSTRKWLTDWITDSARCSQIAGFGLPVAAIAVRAIAAAPAPTSAGASRQARRGRQATPVLYRAVER